jgi:hypothetical protein
MPHVVRRQAKTLWLMIGLMMLFVQPAGAYDSLVTDRVLNLANPHRFLDGRGAGLSKIAAVPRQEFLRDNMSPSTYIRHQSPVLVDKNRMRRQGGSLWLTSGYQNLFLFPGKESLDRIRKDLVRVAALPENPLSVAGKGGERILDRGEVLSSAGSLVGDPRSLFASFEILVDRTNYSVKLFGLKASEKRTVLFECRAGLGSAEYPTPKGTYYIVRIFDDKPLWIPPQDREWAWGQTPSRSVYGGHMMPFFTKQQVNQSGALSSMDEIADHVAPPVRMVDGGMYRIHGTDSPWSVGSSQSHGCVRLLNSSVALLSDTLKMYVGTTARGETPNGPYVSLARPVRLILF